MKEKPKSRDVPARVQLIVKCTAEDCEHRNLGGFCCVGDPQWKWCYCSGRAMNVDCRSYDRRS